MKELDQAGYLGQNRGGVSGLLVIHSAPSALRTHIEWGIQSILGTQTTLTWKSQPMSAGTFRTTIAFRTTHSVTSKLASALRSWHYLRFEVSDDGGGNLYRSTPELGMHRATTDELGNILVSESQIFNAMEGSFDEESLRLALSKVLGTAWEEELEPFRGIELKEVLRLKAI